MIFAESQTEARASYWLRSWLCVYDDLIQLFNFRWNISASIEFNYLDFVMPKHRFNIIIYLKQLIIIRSDTLLASKYVV